MFEAALLVQLDATIALQFRRAELDSALRAVCVACAHYRRHFSDYGSPSQWAESLVWERDGDPDRALLMISRDEVDVAAVEIVTSGGDTLTIALLLVAKAARFSGIGRDIVHCLDAAAKAMGFLALSIGVHVANNDAIAFWSRLGFSDSGFLGQNEQGIMQMERLVKTSDGMRALAAVPASIVSPQRGSQPH